MTGGRGTSIHEGTSHGDDARRRPKVIKSQQSNWAGPDYPSDLRGVGYSYAYVGIKRLGAGQMYLISIRDKDGNGFSGGQTYWLTSDARADQERALFEKAWKLPDIEAM